jgi:hypothetical protein
MEVLIYASLRVGSVVARSISCRDAGFLDGCCEELATLPATPSLGYRAASDFDVVTTHTKQQGLWITTGGDHKLLLALDRQVRRRNFSPPE